MAVISKTAFGGDSDAEDPNFVLLLHYQARWKGSSLQA
jgi:hypothetical protein